MHLILFGLKYSGKTHFGKLLSRRLCCDFIDTDRLIEEMFYKEHNSKLSCREIYQEVGEKQFRMLERDVIHHLKFKKNSVIALGGGTALDARNMLYLSKIGVLVYLKTPQEILRARMLALDDKPAYLSQHHVDTTFDEMFISRESVYSQIPSIHIVTEDKQDEEVLLELENITKTIAFEQLPKDFYPD